MTTVFWFELGDIVHLTIDTIDELGSTWSLHLLDANGQVGNRLLLHGRRQVVTVCWQESLGHLLVVGLVTSMTRQNACKYTLVTHPADHDHCKSFYP